MPVSLHVWRVPRRRVGAALLRMAQRPRGLEFVKFLGTASGFRPSDADWTRYAAVTVSDEPVSFPAWDRLAESRARVDMVPLHSRGTWSGRTPFEPTVRPKGGMVLALTRARLRPTRAVSFWKAIPAVGREVDGAPGLLATFGIGEAPIVWQGTVSLWRDAADLSRFAYRQPEHRAVIARTPADRWYAEELFARFGVSGITGDREVLGWVSSASAATEGER